jgi:hypothetical protein
MAWFTVGVEISIHGSRRERSLESGPYPDSATAAAALAQRLPISATPPRLLGFVAEAPTLDQAVATIWPNHSGEIHRSIVAVREAEGMPERWYVVQVDCRPGPAHQWESEILGVFTGLDAARAACEPEEARLAPLWPDVMPVIVPSYADAPARHRALASARTERTILEEEFCADLEEGLEPREIIARLGIGPDTLTAAAFMNAVRDSG